MIVSFQILNFLQKHKISFSDSIFRTFHIFSISNEKLLLSHLVCFLNEHLDKRRNFHSSRSCYARFLGYPLAILPNQSGILVVHDTLIRDHFFFCMTWVLEPGLRMCVSALMCTEPPLLKSHVKKRR